MQPSGQNAASPPITQQAATPVAPLPELKYAKEIAAYSSCPPDATYAWSGMGYRIVHGDIDHKDNFAPQALIDPRRLVGQAHRHCCSLFALSMYESPLQIQTKLMKALDSSRGLMKRIGDHYAEFEIQLGDGKRTSASGSGHFDFHERLSFDAKLAIRAHAKLFP